MDYNQEKLTNRRRPDGEQTRQPDTISAMAAMAAMPPEPLYGLTPGLGRKREIGGGSGGGGGAGGGGSVGSGNRRCG